MFYALKPLDEKKCVELLRELYSIGILLIGGNDNEAFLMNRGLPFPIVFTIVFQELI